MRMRNLGRRGAPGDLRRRPLVPQNAPILQGPDGSLRHQVQCKNTQPRSSPFWLVLMKRTAAKFPSSAADQAFRHS